MYVSRILVEVMMMLAHKCTVWYVYQNRILLAGEKERER